MLTWWSLQWVCRDRQRRILHQSRGYAYPSSGLLFAVSIACWPSCLDPAIAENKIIVMTNKVWINKFFILHPSIRPFIFNWRMWDDRDKPRRQVNRKTSRPACSDEPEITENFAYNDKSSPGSSLHFLRVLRLRQESWQERERVGIRPPEANHQRVRVREASWVPASNRRKLPQDLWSTRAN